MLIRRSWLRLSLLVLVNYNGILFFNNYILPHLAGYCITDDGFPLLKWRPGAQDLAADRSSVARVGVGLPSTAAFGI